MYADDADDAYPKVLPIDDLLAPQNP